MGIAPCCVEEMREPTESSEAAFITAAHKLVKPLCLLRKSVKFTPVSNNKKLSVVVAICKIAWSKLVSLNAGTSRQLIPLNQDTDYQQA